jgi:hypothetical protein
MWSWENRSVFLAVPPCQNKRRCANDGLVFRVTQVQYSGSRKESKKQEERAHRAEPASRSSIHTASNGLCKYTAFIQITRRVREKEEIYIQTAVCCLVTFSN